MFADILALIILLLLINHLGYSWLPFSLEVVPFSHSVLTLILLMVFFTFMALKHCILGHMSWTEVLMKVRFLFPFALPYLLFILFADIISIMSLSFAPAIVNAAIVFFFLAALFFLPLAFIAFWGCQPLLESPLKDALKQLCHSCHFKHRHLCTWPVMAGSYSAAIIGMVAPLRYVLFSSRLLAVFPQRCIVAILSHEIGHSVHRHLIKYPIIMMSLVVSVLLLSGSTDGYARILEQSLSFIPRSDLVVQFILFAAAALMLLCYFRFFFGYFMRLFERQADLYVFDSGVPAQDLIDALDRVALCEGIPHEQPNWHHYSFAERIAFLQRCQDDPSLIRRHHRTVRLALCSYYIVLAIAGLFLFT